MSYKDKEWLYYEYYVQRRTCEDIANQFGINRKTVSYFLKKFDIQKPCQEADLMVEIACHNCKKPTSKPLQYLVKRVRNDKTKMFCSRECTDAHHSNYIAGENNPNFNGKWNGPPPSEMFTTEQRRQNRLNYINKLKETGEFEEVLRKLNKGHREFYETPEGRALRSANGVKSVLIQAKNKTRRTSIEIKMADELSARGIEYIEQYNLGNKFALDFFLPKYGIVIECDGDYWHRLPKAVIRDKAKNAYVKACGYSIYRFWESEINRDVESCLDVVMAEINAKEPSIVEALNIEWMKREAERLDELTLEILKTAK